jgi:hypothetical protein
LKSFFYKKRERERERESEFTQEIGCKVLLVMGIKYHDLKIMSRGKRRAFLNTVTVI